MPWDVLINVVPPVIPSQKVNEALLDISITRPGSKNFARKLNNGFNKVNVPHHSNVALLRHLT